MICRKCKDAGSMTKNMIENPSDERTQLTRRAIINQLHARCKGKTWCDCQHRIEKKRIV